MGTTTTKKQAAKKDMREEEQLTDKMLKILHESPRVKEAIERLRSTIDTRDRLHADLAHLKGKFEWLTLSLKGIEDDFGQVSGVADAKKYEKYISELDAVTKSIQFLQKRIYSTHGSSIDEEVKDSTLSLDAAIHSTLQPNADDLQKELNKLTDEFLERISVYVEAMVMLRAKQNLVDHEHFPSISKLIPRVQDFDRLVSYADEFYHVSQATLMAAARNAAPLGPQEKH